MGTQSRKPSPAQRRKLAPEIENLVWGLFGAGDRPFFDRGGMSPALLDDFVHCDAVFEETFQYLDALTTIWRQRYPGKPLKPFAQARKSKETLMPLVLPDLSETPAARGRDAGADDAPESAADTTVEETLSMPLSNQPDPPEAAQPGTDPPQGREQFSESDSDAPLPPLKPGDIPSAGAPDPRPPDPRASFNLPNAKVGVSYAATVEGRDADGRPVQLLDMRPPGALGLSFDPASGELRGTPALDGDHRIPLRWTRDGSASYSGDCLLIVNPDPRSLWKVIEPPADAPYPKTHTDSRLLVGPEFKIAAASRRGRSHEHAGTFRDDDFLISQDPDSGWAVILVADGAGSATFSRQGARLAVSAAGAHLVENLAGDFGARMTAALDDWNADPARTGQRMGGEFHYEFHRAGLLAVQSIEREAQAKGALIKDYATTLLAAAVSQRGGETFLATFWMGDGAIAAYGPRGKVRLMGTPDGGEFAGQTRFLDRAALADQSFAKRIGIGRYPDLSAVMLMTDGVSDPRFETDNGLKDPARWDSLWDELAPLLAAPDPDKSLAEWLNFFSRGHHDDRTLAVLF